MQRPKEATKKKARSGVSGETEQPNLLLITSWTPIFQDESLGPAAPLPPVAIRGGDHHHPRANRQEAMANMRQPVLLLEESFRRPTCSQRQRAESSKRGTRAGPAVAGGRRGRSGRRRGSGGSARPKLNLFHTKWMCRLELMRPPSKRVLDLASPPESGPKYVLCDGW